MRGSSRRLRNTAVLLLVGFLAVACLLATQWRGDARAPRGAAVRAAAAGQAEAAEDGAPAGSARWSEALSDLLPQFSGWRTPSAAPRAARDASATSAAGAGPGLPKVALMFLTRGIIPYEDTWRQFLAAVPERVPGASAAGWRALFSVYVHLPPDLAYPEGSLFAGHEIAGRIAVEWGQWSVAQAERLLLGAALADAGNQRFVLVSETCIPLYPGPVVWAQLAGEPRSRLHACRNGSDPADAGRRMAFRWQPAMAGGQLQEEHWRKNGQWFSLTRAHAELVVADTEVADAFKRECWIDAEAKNRGERPSRFCVADEHYIPTLLAAAGRENETDCKGEITASVWDGPYYHPHTFQPGEIDGALLTRMRKADGGRCNAAGALASAAGVFGGAAAPAAAQGAAGGAAAAAIAQDKAARWVSSAARKARARVPPLSDEQPAPGARRMLAARAGAGADEDGAAGASGEGGAAALQQTAADAAALAGADAAGDYPPGWRTTPGLRGNTTAAASPAAGPEARAAAPADAGAAGAGAAPAAGPTDAGAAAGGWDARSMEAPAAALLARFTPLGASDCPLFGRKFAAPDDGVTLARAAHFMARAEEPAGVAPMLR